MIGIDGLAIGSPRDFDLFREDMEDQDGVAFALAPGGSRADGRDRPDGHGALPPTLKEALEKYRPRRTLMLTPYRGMAADVARLMASGVDVRAAGPLPASARDGSPAIMEIHRSDPGFTAMLEASRHADFGEPVYLRVISSPEGGKWHKWWCVFQACRRAETLLNAPLRRVYVAAAGKAPGLHVSVTLKTVRNTTGHLVVAPKGSGLQDDQFFVGTGGTLSDDPLFNQPGMYGESGYRMFSRPHPRRLSDLWTGDAVVSLTGDELRFYRNLLRAIGDSAGSGEGICMEYPTT